MLDTYDAGLLIGPVKEPCPFCGEPDRVDVYIDGSGPFSARVLCGSCGAQTRCPPCEEYTSREQAARVAMEGWNRRAPRALRDESGLWEAILAELKQMGNPHVYSPDDTVDAIMVAVKERLGLLEVPREVGDVEDWER